MTVSPEFNRMRLFSMNPIVGVIEKFLDKRQCEAIRADAKDLLQTSTVLHETEDRQVDKNARTGEVAFVPHGQNEHLDMTRKRLAKVLAIDPDYCEFAQVIRYGPTQEYKAHFDGFPFRPDYYPRDLRELGQRYYTGLLYLSDDFTGGHTEFPKLKIKVSPKVGRMLIWSNTVLGGNSPHPQSLHSGTPVISGTKWAVTFWFRKPPTPDPVMLMPPGENPGTKAVEKPSVQLIKKSPFAG